MKKESFYSETDVKKSNRDKTLSPRVDKFWCYKCDHQLVGDYGKCPNCGCRNNRKRLKRE